MLTITFLILASIIASSARIVPEQSTRIIETFGRYSRTLHSGLHFIIPLVQRVAYSHTLKEKAVSISTQTAISKDNVTLSVDGVLYVQIIDPKAAAYGVEDPYYALSQLAQTTMRSEIGKMPLDKTFEERESLNHAIVKDINEAAEPWGIICLRYEIKDIHPPDKVIKAMEMQVEADRRKRAQILESEGARQAIINEAEANKTRQVLESEASMVDQINRAKGKADAERKMADAKAYSVDIIRNALNQDGGQNAASLDVAQQYVKAFSHLAKTNNTILLPTDISNPSAMVASAMSIYKKVSEDRT